MESKIFISVQNFSNIYTREKLYSTIHFNLLWSINFLSRIKQYTHKLLILHTFKSNNLYQPRWRSGSELVCGSRDPGFDSRKPSPRVGSLMSRSLKTSSDVPVPMQGWLGTLKTPSCPWHLVPGNMSKFGNWTTVPSLYSWNIAECNVKPLQPSNNLCVQDANSCVQVLIILWTPHSYSYTQVFNLCTQVV